MKNYCRIYPQFAKGLGFKINRSNDYQERITIVYKLYVVDAQQLVKGGTENYSRLMLNVCIQAPPHIPASDAHVPHQLSGLQPSPSSHRRNSAASRFFERIHFLASPRGVK